MSHVSAQKMIVANLSDVCSSVRKTDRVELVVNFMAVIRPVILTIESTTNDKKELVLSTVG